eukprot:1948677-Rhodomonas_salina.1
MKQGYGGSKGCEKIWHTNYQNQRKIDILSSKREFKGKVRRSRCIRVDLEGYLAKWCAKYLLGRSTSSREAAESSLRRHQTLQ